MLNRVIVFVFILAFASCIDNKDYTLDSLTLSPTVALPVAFGNISILDLITDKDSAYLKVYPDGLLYFSYSQSLASRDIRNLFIIPTSTTTTGFDFPAGTLPPSSSDVQYSSINQLIDLNLSPEQLSEMLLKAGSINYNISVSQPTVPPNSLPFEVILTLTDVVDKTTGVPLSFSAAVGTGSRPLQNYIINMNKNKFNMKIDLILKKRTNTVLIATGTRVNIQLSFGGLDFTYIKGFFGDQTVALPAQAIDLTVFSSSLNKAKISFVQPSVKLTVRNDYGVPSEVIFTKLEARKTGATLPLQTSPSSPVALTFPTVLGSSSTTTVSVTNAAAVLNFSPTQLYYSGSTRINKGLLTGNNFLADTSKLNVKLAAEVPLYGQASGITLTDTLKLDLGSINQSSVVSAALKVKTVNEMPLDAYIQLYLMDENKKILDSLFASNETYLVKASTVTTSGDLQTAGSTDLKLDLTIDKINKLFSSRYIIVRSKLNTSKDSNGTLLNVKFKASYKLKLDVGLMAKLKIIAK